MYVKILSRDGSDGLTMLDDFEGLTFESCNPGGFTVASFVVHRPVTQQWTDLQSFNRIEIGEGPLMFWQGYIDTPTRKIRPDTIDVQCLGWSARLNELGTTADILVVGAANNQGSDFITNVLLVDADSEIVDGDVETGDYTYPNGTRFEFAPYTTYFDALEQFNAGAGFNWGVWNDLGIYWTAKTPDVIDWYVYTRDCKDLTITPNPAAFANEVLVSYTQDSVHQQTTTRTDAASIAKYGRTTKRMITVPGRITTAGAQSIGDDYLAETANLKVAAEFTTSRVFDDNGSEHHLGEVRGGHNVRLVDWLPTEELLTGEVDDIATFQIKSASYNHDSYDVRITPTEFVPMVETEIARLGVTGY